MNWCYFRIYSALFVVLTYGPNILQEEQERSFSFDHCYVLCHAISRYFVFIAVFQGVSSLAWLEALSWHWRANERERRFARLTKIAHRAPKFWGTRRIQPP